jgi:hypothetical protein
METHPFFHPTLMVTGSSRGYIVEAVHCYALKKEIALMYHPYVNEVAKQRVQERHDRADAVRLAEQARGEHTSASLVSRFAARLSALLHRIKDRTATRQKRTQKLPFDSQVPGLIDE